MMIVGPILTLIMAFTGPLSPNAGVSWSDTQAVLGLLATANTDWAQINFLLLSIGLIMQVRLHLLNQQNIPLWMSYNFNKMIVK